MKQKKQFTSIIYGKTAKLEKIREINEKSFAVIKKDSIFAPAI